MKLVNENVAQEINKIGLELINVNIRDITDESGYIEAIGKRAAAEAINRAKVEVAQQERDGRDRRGDRRPRARPSTSRVSRPTAVQGRRRPSSSSASRSRPLRPRRSRARPRPARPRDRHRPARGRDGRRQEARRAGAAHPRRRGRGLRVTGENTSRAKMAESKAKLAEIQAEAAALTGRAGQGPGSHPDRPARPGTGPPGQGADRAAGDREARIEIAAEAEAEKRRREAQGEADAILAKYQAEAKGVQQVMEAKAEGYRKLIEACGSDPPVGPTLLLIEQLPKLVEQQVKAVQGLKIDKITVWDTGTGQLGPQHHRDFLSGLVGSLPRLHELGGPGGHRTPPALGKLADFLEGVRMWEHHGHGVCWPLKSAWRGEP
jgi:flotillin